ncbi:MAG: NYN domain-containing protein [Acidimicrobiia bacterium]
MRAVTGPWLGMIPDSLLTPLLDEAGETLGHLDDEEVPTSLRPLVGFDRRGLSRRAARKQLRTAFELDIGFRDAVCKHFLERPGVQDIIDVWDPVGSNGVLDALADRGDLPLMASALIAAQPEEWMLSLGMVIGAAEQRRFDAETVADEEAHQNRIDDLEDETRRAERRAEDAEEARELLADELRSARGERREREQDLERAAREADKEAADALDRVSELELEIEELETRLGKEQERNQDLVKQVSELRSDLTEARTQLAEATRDLDEASDNAGALAPGDLRVLGDAADAAQRVADSLTTLAASARSDGTLRLDPRPAPVSPPTGSTRPTAPTRRAEVPVPPGMVADSRDAVRSMLRTPGVVLVVDGYNVTKRVWGEEAASEQRERLIGLLAELHARSRVHCTVVFDGSDVFGPVGSRPGVRVRFSAAGQEADDLVIEEVEVLPKSVPALVVSSDGWVREHARKEGARVVASENFLDALRA